MRGSQTPHPLNPLSALAPQLLWRTVLLQTSACQKKEKGNVWDREQGRGVSNKMANLCQTTQGGGNFIPQHAQCTPSQRWRKNGWSKAEAWKIKTLLHDAATRWHCFPKLIYICIRTEPNGIPRDSTLTLSSAVTLPYELLTAKNTHKCPVLDVLPFLGGNQS